MHHAGRCATETALSEEAEKQTKEFDASLEKETSDEIQKIREDLAREKDAGSMSFVQKPKTSFPGWTLLRSPSRSLCSELFQKITGITET